MNREAMIVEKYVAEGIFSIRTEDFHNYQVFKDGVLQYTGYVGPQVKAFSSFRKRFKDVPKTLVEQAFKMYQEANREVFREVTLSGPRKIEDIDQELKWLRDYNVDRVVEKLKACTSSVEGYMVIDRLTVERLKDIAKKVGATPFGKRKDDYRDAIVRMTVTSRIEHALIRAANEKKEAAE